MSDYPLTQEEFKSIYSKVPRLNVEVVIATDKGVCLTLRDIEPCKGLWHLPGGTVYFGETLLEAVGRIAKRELGITVQGADFLGYIEYPSHYKNGLDHPFGMAFKVTKYDGELDVNKEAKEAGWFAKLPENTHVEQLKFLREQKLAE